MSKIAFQPWVGSKYADGNRFGARVLVLGESHYGPPSDMHPGVTIGVIQRIAKTERQPFFATMAKFLLGLGKEEWLRDHDRAEIWEHVAFYNFIQETVGEYRDSRPTPQMWKAAAEPFQEALMQLKPQVLVVAGKQLNTHLPQLPTELQACRVRHPASGFEYERWNPELLAALARAKGRGSFSLDN